MPWTYSSADRAENLITELQAIDLTGAPFTVIDRGLKSAALAVLGRLPVGAGVVVRIDNDDATAVNLYMRRMRFGSYAT